MKKAMLIINPTSGGEKALDYKEKLENKAKEYFEHVETKITEKALDATYFAEEASREQYDAVVVFGGDGTVNEVVFLSSIHNRFCNSTGHNRVICKKAVLPK